MGRVGAGLTVQSLQQRNGTLEGVMVEYCLGQRLLVLRAQMLTGFPLPLDVLTAPLRAVEFVARVVTLTIDVVPVYDSDAAVEALAVQEAQTHDGPDLVLALAFSIRRGAALLRSPDADRLRRKAVELLDELQGSLGDAKWDVVAVISAAKKVVAASSGTGDELARLHAAVRDRYSHAGQPSPLEASLHAANRTVAEFADNVLAPLNHTRRRLLASGSAALRWIRLEEVNCAFVSAGVDTLNRSFHMLAHYYRDNLTKSAAEFSRFATSQQPSVTTISAGTGTLKQLLAIDQFEAFGEAVAGADATVKGVLDAVLDLFTCNIETVMLCPHNYGLLRKGKFVLLALLLLSMFLYLVFPKSVSLAILVWVAFFPAVIYGTYGVSPTCFPLIPTCLIDDLFNIYASLRPTRDELPLKTLVDAFSKAGHSMATCDAAEFGFGTILGNVAYIAKQDRVSAAGWYPGYGDTFTVSPNGTVAVHTNATILAEMGQKSSVGLPGFFPTFTVDSTYNNTFRLCNYMTLVRNSGYCLAVVAFAPMAVSGTLAVLVACATLALLFCYSVFLCLMLYTNDNEASESGDGVDLLAMAQGVLHARRPGSAVFNQSTLLGLAKTRWNEWRADPATPHTTPTRAELMAQANLLADKFTGPAPQLSAPPSAPVPWAGAPPGGMSAGARRRFAGHDHEPLIETAARLKTRHGGQ
jgi:hypothetical protein